MSLLIRHARPVLFRSQAELSRLRASGTTTPAPAVGEPVDLLMEGGVVRDIGPDLSAAADGAEVLDVEGAFLIPGLWDGHAHLDQEAAQRFRIDTTATRSAEEALALVAAALRDAGAAGQHPLTIQACGHRLSNWPRIPTVAELDAVTGDVPTVLASGDFHSGWLNSAALRHLGLPGATEADPGAPQREDVWFDAVNRLDEIPGNREGRESGYGALFADALSRGVTGVVDMSWTAPSSWGELLGRLTAEAGRAVPVPRIRSAVYRDRLEESIAAGLRTGDPMPGTPLAGDGTPLITRGPLKIIADGSLGTASAHLAEPYPAEVGGEHPHGIANVGPEELTALMTRAREAGYEVAIHSIGDAAIADTAVAFRASGARGRIEHAQLMPADAGPEGALATLVSCGAHFSVQPAHLIDDWAMVDRIWPGRKARAYAFADMVTAGGALELGSDAPVAPLDPWLAISAGVGRVTPTGEVWSPEQRLTPEEALASSVDGAGPVGVGTADLVVLGGNPLELDTERLGAVRPLATVLGGEVVFRR